MDVPKHKAPVSPSVSPEVVPGNVEPSNDSVESLNSPASPITHETVSRVKLSKFEFKQFDGDACYKVEYILGRYEAFIHKNTTIDKFNYLNSILEKTASEKPFQVYPIHNCIKL